MDWRNKCGGATKEVQGKMKEDEWAMGNDRCTDMPMAKMEDLYR